MTEQEMRKKVINGLECCKRAMYGEVDEHGFGCNLCSYKDMENTCHTRTQGKLIGDALALLKAQEPRVMTIQEIKNADFCYLEVNGHDGITPVLLKHFIDDKYIHVTINGGSVYFFDITCDIEKLVRCWTSRPTDEQRQAVKWND